MKAQIVFLFTVAAAWLITDWLLSRRRVDKDPLPAVAVLASLAFLGVALAIGRAWHMVIGIGVGMLLERWRPRRDIAVLSREKFRAVVFLVANLAVVGSLQLVLFGETIQLHPPSWGLSALGAPVALQVLAFLLLNDLKNYWFHRWDHRFQLLWRFHKVHHADAEVSVLSPRDHLSYGLEKLLTNVLVAYALGIETRAFEIAIMTWQVFVQMNHLNVDFPRMDRPFPWFARVLTTPNFHAWHHTVEGGGPRNLCDLFPVWDFLFGTAEIPRTQPSTWTWGVARAEALPPTVMAQMLSPFREARLEGDAAPVPAALRFDSPLDEVEAPPEEIERRAG